MVNVTLVLSNPALLPSVFWLNKQLISWNAVPSFQNDLKLVLKIYLRITILSHHFFVQCQFPLFLCSQFLSILPFLLHNSHYSLLHQLSIEAVKLLDLSLTCKSLNFLNTIFWLVVNTIQFFVVVVFFLLPIWNQTMNY